MHLGKTQVHQAFWGILEAKIYFLSIDAIFQLLGADRILSAEIGAYWGFWPVPY